MKRNHNNTENKIKKVKPVLAALLFIFLLVLIYVLIFGVNTSKYNKQVDLYNVEAQNYNDLSSQISVYNIDGFYDSVPLLVHAKLNPFSLAASRLKGNTIKKINTDRETVENLTNDIKEKCVIMTQIRCPDEEWVIKIINEIEEVSGIQSVDKSNNPDGILGRDGGYKACIYFSLAQIDQEKVPGDTIVDKGTDCGGCIEIYENLKNAEERCTYLAGFDNTILYTGSYAIIGTMVIRTSYMLDQESQLRITDEITQKMTTIDK